MTTSSGTTTSGTTPLPGFPEPGAGPVIPGEIIVGNEPVPLNSGRKVLIVAVQNDGDRPIQVGSHFHLAVANSALTFDRAISWGYRLNIPAGTAVRFEPAMVRHVELVEIAGTRIVPGLSLEISGPLDPPSGYKGPTDPPRLLPAGKTDPPSEAKAGSVEITIQLEKPGQLGTAGQQ